MQNVLEIDKKIKLLEDNFWGKKGDIKPVGGFLGMFPATAQDLVDRKVARWITDKESK